jgi:hypothetical protein
MPQFLNNAGALVGEASKYMYQGEPKRFLDAFVGNQIERTDESGTLRLNPLSGDVELESPGGFKLSASPLQRRVEGTFRFGGPDTSIVGRSPESALDEALGIEPPAMKEPAPQDWQDIWRMRNPNYQ